jgi:hypothetical protein
VRNVPVDYPTIQAAIDDCNEGDTVIIAPGTHTGSGNRDIDFKGKGITVRSVDPNSPIRDELQSNGSRINMGAYGGTVEASKSRQDF